ncbi:hypothetical protein EON83_01105 [bacterium]|nr:MAG: hypothetical protein EON83_01105 [bacterium]
MPTIPVWMQVVLKTIVGACLGTIVGLVAGTGLGYLFAVNTPYNPKLGSSCSQSTGMGFAIIAIVVLGGCLGFVIGTLATLIVSVFKARKRALQHPITNF